MGKRYDSILETVGNTPAVRINNLAPAHVNLYAKVEAFNPMGSVKDRLALGVIEEAERRGDLKPGQTIVEATSGNTGIGLAMVCAQKGYPLVITMAENFSVERRKLMRFLGARVVLTPASEKGSGMVAKARELAEAHGWWQSLQFQNPDNAEVHARTTAKEILEDFDDLPLDYWVTGFGTGGTLNGVSRVLKQRSPHTRVVVCEPDNSAMLSSGIAQQRNKDGSHAASHPRFRPHLMQGWSPDFIPALIQEVMDEGRCDDFLAIDGNVAMQCARDLASKEGIFVGISAGATFAGALQIAQDAPAGSTILCMLPDTGERYLSTPLFAHVEEEMNEEEVGISRSSPSYRFDQSGPPVQKPQVSAPVDERAESELQEILADRDQPVVMFGLEWCEFCWAVRNFLDYIKVPCRSVDLDSVAYQADNRGAMLRGALQHHTGSVTLPQVFIGGEFIGGCTELFDKYNDGSLMPVLESLAVKPEPVTNLDAYGFLPGWVHSRSPAAG